MSSSTNDVTEAFQQFDRILQDSKKLSEKALKFAEIQEENMLGDNKIEKLRKKGAEEKKILDAQYKTLAEEDRELRDLQEEDNNGTKNLISIQLQNELQGSESKKLTMKKKSMMRKLRKAEEELACVKRNNEVLTSLHDPHIYNQASFESMNANAERAKNSIRQVTLLKEQAEAEAEKVRQELEKEKRRSSLAAETHRKNVEKAREQKNELEVNKKELEASLKKEADLRAYHRRRHRQMAPTSFDVPIFPNLPNPLAAGPAPPVPNFFNLPNPLAAGPAPPVPIFPNLPNPLAAGPAPPVPNFFNLPNPLAAGPAPLANLNPQNQEMEEEE